MYEWLVVMGSDLAYCGSCGAQISARARFCTSCGSEQAEEMTSAAVIPSPEEVSSTESRDPVGDSHATAGVSPFGEPSEARATEASGVSEAPSAPDADENPPARYFREPIQPWKRPERLIKDHVEREDGEVVVSPRHLRSSWELTEWSSSEQEAVQEALASVGVTTRPLLDGTDLSEEVTLILVEDGTEAASQPPREFERLQELAPPSPPAGWYADPVREAAERWWSGDGWTSRMRP